MPINISTFAHTAARLMNRFYETGVMLASQFALSDEGRSRQIQFDATGGTAGTASTLSAAPLGSFSLTQTVSSGQLTRYGSQWQPSALTTGTNTTPSATVLYLTQILIKANCTLTGIAINNGDAATTGKYVVALFDSSGSPVANSALAGTATSGTDDYQSVPFTATYAANGPGVYWIGLYVDNTTDRFRSIPAVGAMGGLAGSVTGQTFGTVAAVTLPTTFTADKGPVAFVY